MCVQTKQDQLEKQKQVLEEHKQVIGFFLQHHPSVNVSKYVEKLQALEKSTADMQHKWVLEICLNLNEHFMDLYIACSSLE